MQTIRLKVVMVGESGVGKSSLIRRFVLDEFSDNYVITMGAKVSKKEMYLNGEEPFRILLSIWDIMGAYTLRDLLQDSYFSGAQGILAVFDVSQPQTLAFLEGWHNTVQRVAGDVPWVVVGNKADLLRGPMDPRWGEWAHGRLGVPSLLPTSAKTGHNVEGAFQRLGSLMVGRLSTSPRPPPPPP